MLFAFEAKTAWYGPVAGPGSEVRAAKALPVATPELVEHGVPSPDPEHPTVGFAALLSGASFWSARLKAPLFGRIQPTRQSFFSAAQLSPSLFFRPPPIS
jgi:hypothetical protein